MERRMRKRHLFSILAAAMATGGCDPNVPQTPPITGARPTFNSVTGAIPLPSDVLRDPQTGRLMLPIVPSDSDLTKEVKAGLNKLDGWLAGQTITIPFGAKIDDTPNLASKVRLYDVTTSPAKLWPSSDYYVAFNVGRDGTVPTSPPYTLFIRAKPADGPLPRDFDRGHRYAALVTSDVTYDGGKAFLDDPVLYFLRSSTPLADIDAGHSVTVLPDSQALQLEPTRVVYNDAFKAITAAEPTFDRTRALAFTVFTVESAARAVFNPTPVGTVLPAPIDPISGASVAAPLTSTPSISFDAPLAADSVAKGSYLFAWPPSGILSSITSTASATDSETPRLTLSPTAPLSPSTTYVVVLTDSILSKNGRPTVALSYFGLVRYAPKLLDTTVTPAVLGSPLIDNTLDVLISALVNKDPATATSADWEQAYTLLVPNLVTLETWRSAYGKYFVALKAQKNIDRVSVTALWSFTTKAN
jgi:hypothetical protein